MNISTETCAILLQSMQQMNEMLKEISSSEIEMTQKMMKVSATARILGVGENIDISV